MQNEENRFLGTKLEDIERIISRVHDRGEFGYIKEFFDVGFSGDETVVAKEKIAYIREQRDFVAFLFKSVGYKDFELRKIVADGELNCDMHILIAYPMHDVARKYRVSFHYNPCPRISSMQEFEENIEGIRENLSLLPEEDEQKIADIQGNIETWRKTLEREWEECKELSFEASVRESKFPAGETKLCLSIPQFVAVRIIENPRILEDYKIRFEEIL